MGHSLLTLLSGNSSPQILQSDLIAEYRFNEATGQQILNKVGSNMTASPNLFGVGEQVFALNPALWTGPITATDYFATDPLGNSNATRFVGTAAGLRYRNAAVTVEAGAHTIGLWVKSNTGSPQAIRFSLDSNVTQSSDITVPTTWTRVSYTKTLTAGAKTIYIFNDAALNALDILVYGATLVAGSSDVTYAAPSFDMTLGTHGTTDSADPTWASGSLDFTGSKYAYAVAAPPVSTSALTVYALAKRTGAETGVAGYAILISGEFNFANFALADNYQGEGLQFRFSNATTAKAMLAGLRDSQWHVIAGTYDGTTMRVYVDGIELRAVTSAGAAAVSLKRFFMGSSVFTDFYPGQIGYVAVYTAGHSASQVAANTTAIRAIAAARGFTLPAILPKFIATEGDSITQDNNQTPYAFQAMNVTPAFAQGRNFAVGSSTVVNLNNRAASVDASYDATRQKNILSVLIGRNDFPTNYTNAATYYAVVKTYLLARRAVGWEVMPCTILPATQSGFNALRNSFNTLLRADAALYNSLGTICDFAADPTMGPDSAASDISLYGDGTHPTTAGHTAMATVWRTAVQTLL